jgi:hypothetical protein
VKSDQQTLLEELHRELGASEETEHLIDWLLDSWSTLEMLRERFDEARALQLYTASTSLVSVNEQEPVLV